MEPPNAPFRSRRVRTLIKTDEALRHLQATAVTIGEEIDSGRPAMAQIEDVLVRAVQGAEDSAMLLYTIGVCKYLGSLSNWADGIDSVANGGEAATPVAQNILMACIEMTRRDAAYRTRARIHVRALPPTAMWSLLLLTLEHHQGKLDAHRQSGRRSSVPPLTAQPAATAGGRYCASSPSGCRTANISPNQP